MVHSQPRALLRPDGLVQRRIFRPLVALVAVLALVVTGPVSVVGAQEATVVATTEGGARVRVVHASPDAPAVDVYVDDLAVVEGLEFGAASDFLPVPSGDHQVRVVPAGSSLDEGAVIDDEVGFDDGTTYEVAAMGLLAEIELGVWDLDLGKIDEDGQARVRVIHAAPGVDDIDVVEIGGDTLFEGVGFGDASDFSDIEEGTYNLEVRTGEDDVLLEAPEVAFEADMVYDVFAIGQADDSLQLLPLGAPVQMPCSEVLGVGTDSDACVRIVHAAPDAGDVDIYVGDESVVESSAPGTATDYLNLSAEEQQIRFVAAGGSTDDPVIDLTEELDEGQAYLIVASGSGDEFDGHVFEVDLAPLTENEARVRAIHLGSDVGDVDVAIAGGPVLFEDLAAGDGSDYAVVDAGSFDIEVRATDDEDLAIVTDGLTVAGATVYDIIAFGSAEDGSLQLLPVETPLLAGGADTATPDDAVMTTPATDVEMETPVLEATPEA